MARKSIINSWCWIAVFTLVCTAGISRAALIGPKWDISKFGPIVCHASLFGDNHGNFSPWDRVMVYHLMRLFAVDCPSDRTNTGLCLYYRPVEDRVPRGTSLWIPKNFIREYLAPRLVEKIYADHILNAEDMVNLFLYLQHHEDVSGSLELLLEHPDPSIACMASQLLSYGAIVHKRKWPVEKVMKRMLKNISDNNGSVFLAIETVRKIHDYGAYRKRLISTIDDYRIKNIKGKNPSANLQLRETVERIRKNQLPNKIRVIPIKGRINPALIPGPHHPKPAWLKLKPAKDLLPGENPVIFLKTPSVPKRPATNPKPQNPPVRPRVIQKYPRFQPVQPRFQPVQPGFPRFQPGWYQPPKRPLPFPGVGVFPNNRFQPGWSLSTNRFRPNYGPSQAPKRKK